MNCKYNYNVRGKNKNGECEIQFRIVLDVKKRMRLYKVTEKNEYCIEINTYCTTN